MPTAALASIALEAMRLQNAYALAIDTRDWNLFRTLFSCDVQAFYPHAEYAGLDQWLADFEPMHDGYDWSMHVMSTHVVGEDAGGIWGTCYGAIQWSEKDRPGRFNRATVLYRDRLAEQNGSWRITRRRLDLLLVEAGAAIRPGIQKVQSVLDMADRR